MAYTNREQVSMEKRQARRYRMKKKLIATCKFYSGEIIDINRTGMAFQVAHVRKDPKEAAPRIDLDQGRTVHVFSLDQAVFLLQDLQVDHFYDTYSGYMYRDNEGILMYRRGVKFAVPLTGEQMKQLLPFVEKNGKGRNAANSRPVAGSTGSVRFEGGPGHIINEKER